MPRLRCTVLRASYLTRLPTTNLAMRRIPTFGQVLVSTELLTIHSVMGISLARLISGTLMRHQVVGRQLRV